MTVIDIDSLTREALETICREKQAVTVKIPLSRLDQAWAQLPGSWQDLGGPTDFADLFAALAQHEAARWIGMWLKLLVAGADVRFRLIEGAVEMRAKFH